MRYRMEPGLIVFYRAANFYRLKFLMMGAGDDARPEGPKLEARRAESGGGVLGEGAASPLLTSQGSGGAL